MNDPKNYPYQDSQEAVFSNFMQRVYQWMAMGLALTGLLAFMTLQNVPLMRFLLSGGMWLFFIVELGIVIWLSASIRKISAQAATLGFLIYSALNGVTLSGIFLYYTAASISSTFFITAMTFAGVSIYGWVTKHDLTSIGSFCFMALIGVIIASVLNYFFRSPAFYWIVSYAGVAVFIGLTAYDTQKLKMIHQGMPNAPEQLAIFGALMLYLDFINMFLFLLRIFGRRR
ncbi:MAG TPA: Bax inhibitor-1/YccA family protein [Candidatus Omnitrophota bacterium]|nr:Bax inhibitor-1/YccA family protein [Candidatus Omnitrophota bacterium]HRY85016.1 Bax inhibitor-1/YccA family protein [Candidatus Omnitrophota bacterium]